MFDYGVPRPEINFVIDEYTQSGAKAFEGVVKQIYGVLGVRDEDIHFVDGYGGAGHTMGTHRMGADPQRVGHRQLRLHARPPEPVADGSGLFPTVDACNPTLTIVALTLRQADKMIAVLNH